MTRFYSRRSVLSLGAAALAASALPLPAMADAASAQRLVDKLVADINKAIAGRSSDSALFRNFEQIFVKYADVPTIARYALGSDARSASAGQMKAFTQAFQGYISRKYGKRFREFIGGKIEVNSSSKVKSFYEVKTTAILKGEAPFEVVFLVSDKSGSDRFFNMFIEGVNMLLTERTEIGAMLDKRRGNLDQLIADLKTAG